MLPKEKKEIGDRFVVKYTVSAGDTFPFHQITDLA